MSFVDLATLTLHRRNELEARTKIFLGKCDQAIKDIEKLKLQAQNFVLHLNCEPSELKERFLSCMKNLDEYTYLITDFNLSVNKLEELTTSEYTPVHDNAVTSVLPTPQCGPINLIDVLSEPTPSTSTACSNLCPSKAPKRKKVPKEDQLLIAFSSASSSSESVPQNKTDNTKEVEIQCELTTDLKNMTIKAPLTPAQDSCNLPAQKVLQTDHSYNATIMSIDDGSFWVITESTDEVCTLMKGMTDYYKSNHFDLTLDELTSLTYCAFYDEESDCFYRALFIKLVDEETMMTEVFLVDTGEVRTGAASCVQPLEPQFCARAPYARCCHLAGIDMLSHQNQDLMAKQEQFMREYVGTNCTIEVDDNTSESLGVYVILPSKRILNEILIQEGFAQPIDKPKSEMHQVVQGPPEVLPEDSDFDITQCPEFEDPVEAVTGYSNRDEADICKHYKGGPEKTCFKGSRCNKKHILKHPDGWTLDRVEVPAKITSVALPPPDTWLKVVVTYVCHFNRLYVQFDNNKQIEQPLFTDEIPSFGIMLPPSVLPALVRDMNSPATRITYKPLTMTPAPGELVAALYPLDNQWYRARVLTVTRADQSVEVMYIDYGNVVWVKEDQIRVLEPRYMALPAQATRCVLAGVRARSSCSRLWADAKAALARMVQDRTLDAHVICRDYDELTVELFDAEGYSIAEQLATHEVIELDDYAVTDDTKVTQKVIPA